MRMRYFDIAVAAVLTVFVAVCPAAGQPAPDAQPAPGGGARGPAAGVASAAAGSQSPSSGDRASRDSVRAASDRLQGAAGEEIRSRRKLVRLLSSGGPADEIATAREEVGAAQAASTAASEKLAELRRRLESPPLDPEAASDPAAAEPPVEAERSGDSDPTGGGASRARGRVLRLLVRLGLAALALVSLVVAHLIARRRVDRWLLHGAHDDATRRAEARLWVRRGLTVATVALAVIVVLGAAGAGTTALAVAVLLSAIAWIVRGILADTVGGVRLLRLDSHRRGEHVRLAGLRGRVEEVDVWTTTLRSDDGARCVVPHRAVGVVENESRGPRRAIIEVSVAFDADIERAGAELLGAAQDVVRDERFARATVGEPALEGVDRIEGGGLVCRLVVAVRAGRDEELRREILRRAVERFRAAELTLAVPARRMIHHIDRPPSPPPAVS